MIKKERPNWLNLVYAILCFLFATTVIWIAPEREPVPEPEYCIIVQDVE